MTENDPNDASRQDGLMGEATVWFARMRGPEAEQHRPAFETWLARGALHRAFYNRAGEIYALGKFLKEEQNAGSSHEPPAGDDEAPAAKSASDGMVHRRAAVRKMSIAFVLLAAASMCLLIFVWQRTPKAPVQPPVVASERNPLKLVTGPGQVLAQLLSDGSKVTLQPNSALAVDYTVARRALRLERGSSKFEVAHEARPFVVFAGTGSITARGTIFEVAVLPRNQVSVHLIRGKVDVAIVGRAGKDSTRQMNPGESLVLTPQEISAAAPTPHVEGAKPAMEPADQPIWREYHETPVEAVIADSNDRGGLAIRLGSPDLGALKVSGRLRIDDAAKLADKLAASLNLTVVRTESGEIVLQRH